MSLLKSYKRILVTGATGFLGHHIVPVLQSRFDAEIISVGRRDYNLLEPGQPERMLRETAPDCVVHLAAKSGGIVDNRLKPADYFYENIVMNTHVFHASFRSGVKKFLSLMGGCSYPASAKSPIGEDQMWNGYPQEDSAGYSMAKKMILVQSWAYRQQHGFNSITLIPGNVYGEWDNFNMTEAHAIPAMIRKCAEASDRKLGFVTAMGTGRALRDFVYAGDVAAVLPWFLEHYSGSDPVNICTGEATSVRDLAETVRAATGFTGEIRWDAGQPEGQIEKVFSPARLNGLGLSCPTPLSDGIAKTVSWFLANRGSSAIRM